MFIYEYLYNFQIENQKKCGVNKEKHLEQCALRHNMKNGHREVVVPTYESETGKPCTDIMDLETLQWRKMEKDSRKALYGGYIMR